MCVADNDICHQFGVRTDDHLPSTLNNSNSRIAVCSEVYVRAADEERGSSPELYIGSLDSGDRSLLDLCIARRYVSYTSTTSATRDHAREDVRNVDEIRE